MNILYKSSPALQRLGCRALIFRAYSPSGPVKTVSVTGGVNWASMVYRLESQAPAGLAFAWEIVQICVPSGLVKNLCYQ